MPSDGQPLTRALPLPAVFKHGIIGISYDDGVAGRSFAAQETLPHRSPQLDFFVDYSSSLADITLPNHMINPYGITISSLRDNIDAFATRHPNARFALLRLWSAPYFYPLMVGYNNRPHQTFMDAVGRFWEWRFVPKDMPYSEHSVHYNLFLRFEPHMSHFTTRSGGGKIEKLKIRKDVVLVMGDDEDDLVRLASAATFILQTQPWRLEFDFWKSFVNVDATFLKSLDDVWWS